MNQNPSQCNSHISRAACTLFLSFTSTLLPSFKHPVAGIRLRTGRAKSLGGGGASSIKIFLNEGNIFVIMNAGIMATIWRPILREGMKTERCTWCCCQQILFCWRSNWLCVACVFLSNTASIRQTVWNQSVLWQCVYPACRKRKIRAVSICRNGKLSAWRLIYEPHH